MRVTSLTDHPLDTYSEPATDLPELRRTMIPSEDSGIRRIALGNVPPMGYPFLSAKFPAAGLNFAREMTLQSGKILYEVWDYPKRTLVGYNIPTDIQIEAKKHVDGRADLRDWQSLPREARRAHCQTHQLVIDQFPNLPISCSKLLAESLVANSYRGKITTQDIEREAVEHAKLWWSDYSCRVEHSKREGKWSVWEEDQINAAVRPAMRAALEKWMGSDRSAEWRERFFDKHNLTVVESGFARRTSESRKIGRNDSLRRQLLWHEEMGKIVGVNTAPREPDEQKVRRFL